MREITEYKMYTGEGIGIYRGIIGYFESKKINRA
jgi:hypothetical protein